MEKVFVVTERNYTEESDSIDSIWTSEEKAKIRVATLEIENDEEDDNAEFFIDEFKVLE